LYIDLHSFECKHSRDIAGSDGSSIVSVFRNLHTEFHTGCGNVHSYQMFRGSFFLTSLPAFAFVGLLDDNHSYWGEMECQNYFDLHFFMAK
jgi:hypothetical protein